MRGKLSSTVLKTSTGSDTCAEFIQIQNKKEALRILTARVNNQDRDRVEAAYSSDRKRQLGNGGRGDKIRTYNFIKSRCVDHRLGVKTRNVRDVIERGNFGLILNSTESAGNDD